MDKNWGDTPSATLNQLLKLQYTHYVSYIDNFAFR